MCERSNVLHTNQQHLNLFTSSFAPLKTKHCFFGRPLLSILNQRCFGTPFLPPPLPPKISVCTQTGAIFSRIVFWSYFYEHQIISDVSQPLPCSCKQSREAGGTNRKASKFKTEDKNPRKYKIYSVWGFKNNHFENKSQLSAKQKVAKLPAYPSPLFQCWKRVFRDNPVSYRCGSFLIPLQGPPKHNFSTLKQGCKGICKRRPAKT